MRHLIRRVMIRNRSTVNKRLAANDDVESHAVFENLILSTSKPKRPIKTPIIGILSQEKYIVAHVLPEEYESFIAASYVKYLESAGARVVPVWIGQNKEYYQRVVNYTNGILFPGGGTYFNESGGYGEAAKQLYAYAVQANDRGNYYPIWGTCLGMQVIPFAEIGTDIRVDCSLKNVALPLDFLDDYRTGRMFSKAPDEIIQILKSKNVTYNFHRYCLTKEILESHGIASDWKILSTNKDHIKLQFISSMEHVEYPFYGVQFHPEKNSFEFKISLGVPHTGEAVKVTQYFANFFVEECKKNKNCFPNFDLETDSLIYNFNPLFTGKQNSTYEQIYAFNSTDYDKVQLV